MEKEVLCSSQKVSRCPIAISDVGCLQRKRPYPRPHVGEEVAAEAPLDVSGSRESPSPLARAGDGPQSRGDRWNKAASCRESYHRHMHSSCCKGSPCHAEEVGTVVNGRKSL